VIAKPGQPGHVHDSSCDRVAVIRLIDEACVERDWGVGAACTDDEESVKVHVARTRPGARFLSVEFVPANVRNR
jgi:hypothetical protein